jgi:hypothetical protein
LGGHCAATQGPLAGLVPFAPFITIVGHKRGMGCVGVLGTWKRERERERERERRCKRGEENLLPLPTAHVQGKKMVYSIIKRRRLILPFLFLITINKTTSFYIKRAVSFK